MISDFYEQPETIVQTIEPLRFHGNEVVLFHILDPQEIRPELKGHRFWSILRHEQQHGGIPDYGGRSIAQKIDAHIEQMRDEARAAGMEYQLLVTDQAAGRSAAGVPAPLRQGRHLMGFLAPWFLAGWRLWGCRYLCICCASRRRSHGRSVR